MKETELLYEINSILTDYLVRGTDILENASNNLDKETAKEAEKYFEQGLSKLKRIKTTSEERKKLRDLKRAFECAIKSTKALRKEQYEKASKYAHQSTLYGIKYQASILAVDKR